jgi:hypothetical protein
MRTNLKYIYKYLGIGLVALLILPACKKQPIETPNFDVSVAKTTYAINEPIPFTISGTADIVTFYSGISTATGNSEYKNKERLTVTGKPQLQFTSFKSGASMQTGTLQVLASTDFVNAFNADDIQRATWKDLTSRATLSGGVDNTPSGVVDLSDLYASNVPVYIAFHYVAKQDAAVAQPTWTIKNVAVNNVAADGTVTSIVNQTTAAWAQFSIANSANLWAFNTTALTFTGGAINAADNDDWLISQPLQLDRAQRGIGVSIRASSTTRLTDYTFPGYATAGTYTVSFEAINANLWGSKTTVKEFTITVK